MPLPLSHTPSASGASPSPPPGHPPHPAASQTHIGESYDIVDATAYFRVHDDGQLYLLYLPAIQMVYTPTGSSVRPEGFPATPRARQPELSFLGQMPRDFFRCPTCGKSVLKEDRTQVPCLRLSAAARGPQPAACSPQPAARSPQPAARSPQSRRPTHPLSFRARCLSARC